MYWTVLSKLTARVAACLWLNRAIDSDRIIGELTLGATLIAATMMVTLSLAGLANTPRSMYWTEAGCNPESLPTHDPKK